MVSFDRSVRGRRDVVSFVIRSSTLGIVAVEGSFLFEPTVPMAELQGAWAGSLCLKDFTGRPLLRGRTIIIEGDSTTIIFWIREAMQFMSMHLLIHDIALFLQGCSDIIVRHIY